MRSKYGPLEEFLKEQRSSHRQISLSFAEIESIIQAKLPQSAYSYREWWSNQSDVSHRPQAKAWLNAGYRVDNVQQRKSSGTVRFAQIVP